MTYSRATTQQLQDRTRAESSMQTLLSLHKSHTSTQQTSNREDNSKNEVSDDDPVDDDDDDNDDDVFVFAPCKLLEAPAFGHLAAVERLSLESTPRPVDFIDATENSIKKASGTNQQNIL